MRENAERMAKMDPSQMKAQAKALRNANPDMIRRSNPHMRNLTNAQILEAANQMEQMASDPAMMKEAAEQMKNMSPEQLEGNPMDCVLWQTRRR
jgi:hypothetical protein